MIKLFSYECHDRRRKDLFSDISYIVIMWKKRFEIGIELIEIGASKDTLEGELKESMAETRSPEAQPEQAAERNADIKSELAEVTSRYKAVLDDTMKKKNGIKV